MKDTPSRAIQQTIVLLEQEIEVLEQRRGELLRVIDSLRPLAGEARSPGRRKKHGLKKRTNERTNERTSKARANGTPTEPP